MLANKQEAILVPAVNADAQTKTARGTSLTSPLTWTNAFSAVLSARIEGERH
jgi:hypothetical protein